MEEYTDKDFQEIASELSTDSGRTARFFQKASHEDLPPQDGESAVFDLKKSIRLSTRRLGWHGEKIDHTGFANENEFEILRKLGGGGMGAVYAALQKSVDREVALKMISPELANDNSYSESFLREAVVTGNLCHPNIVSVHDLGQSGDGSLFYTMQKIVGISWDAVIERKSEDENIEILLKVCDAIAYAHSKGVIHRDLKPANILLGDFGEVMVTDWGVAASAGNFELSGKAIRLTKDSDIEGTPAYMPPEMLDPDVERIGPKSDIYLLGGILYEIVTGLKPHKIASGNMIHAIRYNIIQPTSKTGELIDIALKGMATKPEHRHESVKDFQTAIRGYLIHRDSIRLSQSADESFELACVNGDYHLYSKAMYAYQQAIDLWPENAKAGNGLRMLTVNYAERAFSNGDFDLALSILDADNPKHQSMTQKIKREKALGLSRKKRLRILSLVFVASLVATIAILAFSYTWVNNARKSALMEERRAKQLLELKEQENYYNTISLAANSLRLMSPLAARNTLDKVTHSRRGLEWDVLAAIATPMLREIKAHDDSVTTIGLSPNGSMLFSGGRDGTVKIWNGSGQRLLHSISFTSPIQRLLCSPDGNKLLVIRSDRLISIISTATGEITRTIDNDGGNVCCADFMPNGRQLILGTQDGRLILFDLEAGIQTRSLKAHDKTISAISCLPRAGLVITSSWDHSIKIWKMNDWSHVATLSGHSSYIDALAVSPDAELIASGGGDHTINVWKINGNEKIASFKNLPHSINSLAFSADGNTILATYGNRADLIATISGKTLKNFELPAGVNIYAGIFSHDNEKIITGDGNNKLLFWDAVSRLAGAPPLQFPENKRQPLATGNSLRAAAFTGDNNTVEITFEGGNKPLILAGHSAKISDADFIPKSSMIATSSYDTSIRIWDCESGQTIHILGGHSRYVSSVKASADGRKIVSSSWDGTVRVWDVATGKNLMIINAHDEPATFAAFSPDSKKIVSCGSDGSAKIWDISSRALIATLKGHSSQVNCALFSKDGSRVVTTSDDCTIRIWDSANAREILTLPTGGRAFARLSLNGGRLGATSQSGANSLNWIVSREEL